MGSEWGLVSWKENPVYAVHRALRSDSPDPAGWEYISLLSLVKVCVSSGARVCVPMCVEARAQPWLPLFRHHLSLL